MNRDILTTAITLARLMRTAADKRARAHGMTRAQWAILVQLDRSPGLLQKELAELLEVEPITVARLIDRLEMRGMVERRGDPADRRCWHLYLTGESKPLLNEINANLDDLANTVCKGISVADRKALAAMLHHMRDRASQEVRKAAAAAAETLTTAA